MRHTVGLAKTLNTLDTKPGSPDPFVKHEHWIKMNAADEMYEALKWCANHLRQIAERDFQQAVWDNPSSDLKLEDFIFNSEKNARIALAKAEGR